MSTKLKLKKVIYTIRSFSTFKTLNIFFFIKYNIISFLLNFKLAYKNYYVTIKERVTILL